MTDRIKSLTVVLEPDVRDDDCEAIITAIRCIRRVVEVKPHVADMEHYAALSNATHDWGMLMYDFLSVALDHSKRKKLKKLIENLREEGRS